MEQEKLQELVEREEVEEVRWGWEKEEVEEEQRRSSMCVSGSVLEGPGPSGMRCAGRSCPNPRDSGHTSAESRRRIVGLGKMA